MRIIPIDTWTISTKLSKQEVLNRIDKVTNKKFLFSFSCTEMDLFIGRVYESGFVIRPIFIPPLYNASGGTMRGSVTENNGITTIKVTTTQTGNTLTNVMLLIFEIVLIFIVMMLDIVGGLICVVVYFLTVNLLFELPLEKAKQRLSKLLL